MDPNATASATATNLEGNVILQNEQGTVVAIVTDINNKDNQTQETTKQSQQHYLSTDSNQTAAIIPPLIPDTTDNTIKPEKPEIDCNVPGPEKTEENQIPIPNLVVEPEQTAPETQYIPPQIESRWSKENRIVLKQLMGSLPPHDIGAALRVILDTFGVESSKLVRRGEFVELDLQHINDDYILDSLWNYCAQMQFNIMNTFQQPMAQMPQQFHYQQQAVPVQQTMYQQQIYATQPQQQIYSQVQPQQMQQMQAAQIQNDHAMQQQYIQQNQVNNNQTQQY